MTTQAGAPPLLKETGPWRFRFPEVILLVATFMWMVVEDANMKSALVFVAPMLLGVLLMCMVLGIPLQRQPVNKFWGDAAYIVVGVLGAVILAKSDNPYGALPAIMPYVAVAIILTGVSAALRRAIALLAWKRK
ncbi:hypothetical protein [Corynebacterium afermentans]|uniref:hypothetical protein n=1 Tax=Corynebacterium afermentans TaxID=38286 RepID=UPI0025747355|nr:hypothetical protein [Corynebacterium afermentans]MDC7108498.1 hypothetical protein [Corynebacterium afermentans]